MLKFEVLVTTVLVAFLILMRLRHVGLHKISAATMRLPMVSTTMIALRAAEPSMLMSTSAPATKLLVAHATTPSALIKVITTLHMTASVIPSAATATSAAEISALVVSKVIIGLV